MKRRIAIDKFESLSHSKWERKYHVVLIPKGRRKTLYAGLPSEPLGELFIRNKPGFGRGDCRNLMIPGLCFTSERGLDFDFHRLRS